MPGIVRYPCVAACAHSLDTALVGEGAGLFRHGNSESHRWRNRGRGNCRGNFFFALLAIVQRRLV